MKTNTLSKMNFSINASVRGSQRGVGMVEVLIALLLMAIGVLGYAALQVRAVEATSQALNRSQAMVILRGLAEEIRVNNAAQSSYPTAISGFANATTAPALGTNTNCYTATACTSAQLAAFDAYQTASTAFQLGMKINMTTCPGVSTTSNRQCLFAAWGKTTATIGTGATDCMTSAGVYQSQATCVMMEAY